MLEPFHKLKNYVSKLSSENQKRMQNDFTKIMKYHNFTDKQYIIEIQNSYEKDFLKGFLNEYKKEELIIWGKQKQPYCDLYLVSSQKNYCFEYLKIWNWDALHIFLESEKHSYIRKENECIGIFNENVICPHKVYCYNNRIIYQSKFFSGLNLDRCWDLALKLNQEEKSFVVRSLAEVLKIIYLHNLHWKFSYENIFVDILEKDSMFVVFSNMTLHRKISCKEEASNPFNHPEILKNKNLVGEMYEKVDVWSLSAIICKILGNGIFESPVQNINLPDYCSVELQEILLQSLNTSPEMRPKFIELYSKIRDWEEKINKEYILEKSLEYHDQICNDIQFYCDPDRKRKCHILVYTTKGKADIFFNEGKIISVQYGNITGVTGLYEILDENTIIENLVTISTPDLLMPLPDGTLKDFGIFHLANESTTKDILRSSRKEMVKEVLNSLKIRKKIKCCISKKSFLFEDLLYGYNIYFFVDKKSSNKNDEKNNFFPTSKEAILNYEQVNHKGHYVKDKVVFMHKNTLGEIYFDIRKNTPCLIQFYIKPQKISFQYWKKILFRVKRANEILVNIPSNYFTNIIGDFEIIEKDNKLFAIQTIDYFPGIPLSQILKKTNSLSTISKYLILYLLAKALSTLHSCSVVHRYICPESIIVGINGEIKINNFIVAKFESDDFPLYDVVNTLPGEKLCPILYSSPEQVLEGMANADRYTDIWSWGIIAYELVTGVLPFKEHDDIVDTIHSISYKKPDFSIVNDPIKTLIISTLEKKAKNRISADKICENILPLLSKKVNKKEQNKNNFFG